MATLQPMVCLLVASCLLLLGGSEAQYPGYYQGGYPAYPYKAYPSYPYAGWPLKHDHGVYPLKHDHGVYQPVDRRLPVHYHPGPYQPFAPKHDGLHQHYPHVQVVRPAPLPQFNVYNIFDGGITKQSATSQAGANTPTRGGSSRQVDSSESQEGGLSSREALSASGEWRASRESWASGKSRASPTLTAATTGRAPARPALHSHATGKQTPSPKPPVTPKPPATPKKVKLAIPAQTSHAPSLHLTFKSGGSQKATPAPPPHSAKKLAAAAPAYTNHGWFPHKAVHV